MLIYSSLYVIFALEYSQILAMFEECLAFYQYLISILILIDDANILNV